MKNYKKSFQARRYRLVAFLIVILLLAASCSQYKLLKSFKQHHKEGDYAWIANQSFECNKSNETCGQFHLIKGNACYHMAKQSDSLRYYECAVHHLENGINMTSEWTNANERDQYYENLCESLRNLQDMQKDAKGNATLVKFVEWAEKYLVTAEKEYEPVFFYAKAKLRSMEPGLLIVDDDTRKTFCDSLQDVRSLVARTIKRGEADPDSEMWSSQKPYFNELTTDLDLMAKAAGCQSD